jgi:TusA-related sulfurtransferase
LDSKKLPGAAGADVAAADAASALADAVGEAVEAVEAVVAVVAAAIAGDVAAGSRRDFLNCMPLRANIELNADAKTFASGLLVELIAALRRTRPGDLVAVISPEHNLGPEFETWCRFTRNSLVETTVQEGHYRWVIRNGEVPASLHDDRPIGSRLWLYTNFDCNLRCDYCCVRPRWPRSAAPHRAFALHARPIKLQAKIRSALSYQTENARPIS